MYAFLIMFQLAYSITQQSLLVNHFSVCYIRVFTWLWLCVYVILKCLKLRIASSYLQCYKQHKCWNWFWGCTICLYSHPWPKTSTPLPCKRSSHQKSCKHTHTSLVAATVSFVTPPIMYVRLVSSAATIYPYKMTLLDFMMMTIKD